MRPHRARIIFGVARRMVWKAPVRLVCSTEPHASSLIRAIRPSAVMPALFTRISTDPNASSISPKARSTESVSETSACTGWVSPPAACTALAVSFAPSASEE